MPLSRARSQLIRHTIDNFNIHPDKQAVARINESLSTLQQARELRLREAENALKSTSRYSPSPPPLPVARTTQLPRPLSRCSFIHLSPVRLTCRFQSSPAS